MAFKIFDTTDNGIVRMQSGIFTGANSATQLLLQSKGIKKLDVPPSQDLTGIELRIKSIFIKDNRTPAFGPFPGRANFYLLTIVVSDVANQSVKPVNVITFPRIGDEEALPTRETLFYYVQDKPASPMPQQLHLVASVIKSKRGLREAGAIMSDLESDGPYKDLLAQIAGLASDATAAGAIISLVQQLSGIIGNYLGKIEDRPLATVMRSFTGLAGDWDKLGVNPVAITTKFVNFTFELIVRNKGREQLLAKTLNLRTKDISV